jgi:intracellular multiplication protein IcmT
MQMEVHWRDTQRPARFFIFDARSFAAIFLFLIHARLWTFSLAIVVMIIFWLFERRGLTFESALRAIRAWILGSRRPAILKNFWRSRIDFG